MVKSKINSLFIFLLMMCWNTLQAQYVNTDSLVFIPGMQEPVSINQTVDLGLNGSWDTFEENQTAGELLSLFGMPGEGKIISRFGVRSGRMHYGVDIKMPKGDTIYAAYNGRVSRSSYYYGFGNLVVIQHGKSLETYYGHLSKYLVHSGAWVQKGEPIGLAGATGRATTNHLHFEIHENERPYDPELVYDFENNQIRTDAGDIENLAELHQELRPKGYSVNGPLSQKYVVRSGDSLWKISQRAKTSIQNLCRLNNLTETTVLQVGQVLNVY